MLRTSHTAAIEEWKASVAAVNEGRISYAEHQAWVLSQHAPDKRPVFEQLWRDAEETMAIFEAYEDKA